MEETNLSSQQSGAKSSKRYLVYGILVIAFIYMAVQAQDLIKSFRQDAELSYQKAVIGGYDSAQKVYFTTFHKISTKPEEMGYELPENFLVYSGTEIPQELKEKIDSTYRPIVNEGFYRVIIIGTGKEKKYIWALGYGMKPKLLKTLPATAP